MDAAARTVPRWLRYLSTRSLLLGLPSRSITSPEASERNPPARSRTTVRTAREWSVANGWRSRRQVSLRVTNMQTVEQRWKSGCAAAGYADAVKADTASESNENERGTPSLACDCSPYACHTFTDGMVISCSCRRTKQGCSKRDSKGHTPDACYSTVSCCIIPPSTGMANLTEHDLCLPHARTTGTRQESAWRPGHQGAHASTANFACTCR